MSDTIIEDLRTALGDYAEDDDGLADMIDVVRILADGTDPALVKRAEQAEAERDSLRAEVERLRAERDGLADALTGANPCGWVSLAGRDYMAAMTAADEWSKRAERALHALAANSKETP